MSDDDDDFEAEDIKVTPDERAISRREAAARLKVDPRTIVRWVKSGILKQTENRKFLPSELDAFIKRSKEDPAFASDDPEETDYWQELTQALALSNQHNERLLSLIDKPLNMVLTMLTASNAQYAARVADSDKAYLEAMKLLGEQLMQKEDRQSKADREAVKTALIASAGENIMGALPAIVAQLMGKKGAVKVDTEKVEAVKNDSAIGAFIACLDKNDLQKLMLMRSALAPEKRALFEAALAEMGVTEEKANG